jgi:Recombination endonuclease VII
MTKQRQRQAWRYNTAKYRTTHQKQVLAYARRYHWKKVGIDITDDDYDALFEAQGGLCAICRRPGGSRRLHVDHDHDTKYIRGLLCHKCNVGLGNFDDSVLLLETAIEYMKAG